jgi:hypothetical protein
LPVKLCHADECLEECATQSGPNRPCRAGGLRQLCMAAAVMLGQGLKKERAAISCCSCSPARLQTRKDIRVHTHENPHGRSEGALAPQNQEKHAGLRLKAFGVMRSGPGDAPVSSTFGACALRHSSHGAPDDRWRKSHHLALMAKGEFFVGDIAIKIKKEPPLRGLRVAK